MFFANEQRDNVREENPGITFGMTTDTLFTVIVLLTGFRFRPSGQGPRREMEGSQQQAARAV